MQIEPFTIAIPDADLVDLSARLDRARWPDQIAGIGWDQGTELAFLKELVAHWRSRFDWRAQERALNTLPQFQATIGDERVHFVHVRAKPGRGLPIIVTHGWPGSFAEMVKIIPMLADPETHGGSADDAFDVVVPSLPGYGFSRPPRHTGMNPSAIATLWADLMAGLGYDRFGAQGGDWGSSVSTRLALNFPDRIIGLHLNFVSGSLQPHHDPSDRDLTDDEKAARAALATWVEEEGAYGRIQGTKPQTLAYGLNDSPIGLAGWIVEKFRAWSDCGGDVERAFTRDELLTNIAIYWFTQTIGSSVRLYWEGRRHQLRFKAGEGVKVPTAVAVFPKEIWTPPRDWVERAYAVRRWTPMPRGGHFAALEQPELLVEDIRAFFRELR